MFNAIFCRRFSSWRFTSPNALMDLFLSIIIGAPTVRGFNIGYSHPQTELPIFLLFPKLYHHLPSQPFFNSVTSTRKLFYLLLFTTWVISTNKNQLLSLSSFSFPKSTFLFTLKLIYSLFINIATSSRSSFFLSALSHGT